MRSDIGDCLKELRKRTIKADTDIFTGKVCVFFEVDGSELSFELSDSEVAWWAEQHKECLRGHSVTNDAI